MNIFFYITAAVALVAALAAISRREAMHGIFYLIVMLIAMALLFYQLGAPFVAALEIIVYAGAIIILFLFVVMMLNPQSQSRGTILTVWFGPLVLTAILATQWFFLLQDTGKLMAASAVGPALLGQTFFAKYAYSLHLVALFLLVGLVGAFHLGYSARITRCDSSVETANESEGN